MAVDQSPEGVETQFSKTILLVDDEPSILSSLRRLLRPEGYKVLVAETGPVGLDLMSRHIVQVVVSDGLMVGETGVEFLMKVREANPSCVRIMLTGLTDPQISLQAKAQCDLFAMLTKPWSDAELLETISAAFRHYESAPHHR
jgi:response regulator RpfG family c-di-GMP phosphodiesterase